MTKKDFIQFAAVIKELRTFDLDAAQFAFNQFCSICWRSNTHFNSTLFREACGLSEEQLSCKEAIGTKKVTRKFLNTNFVPTPSPSKSRRLV